jgi:hypothetical protein
VADLGKNSQHRSCRRPTGRDDRHSPPRESGHQKQWLAGGGSSEWRSGRKGHLTMGSYGVQGQEWPGKAFSDAAATRLG